jgi:hypothetical protein
VAITEGAAAVLSNGVNFLYGGSATNTLTLTGLVENCTVKVNAEGSDTITDKGCSSRWHR